MCGWTSQIDEQLKIGVLSGFHSQSQTSLTNVAITIDKCSKFSRHYHSLTKTFIASLWGIFRSVPEPDKHCSVIH